MRQHVSGELNEKKLVFQRPAQAEGRANGM
jgi:hypothetical protein